MNVPYKSLLCALVALAAAGCGRSGGDEAQREAEVAEEEHSDEQRVTLTEAAMKTAEIVVEPAVSEQAARAAQGLEVPGEVHFDPRRVAIISPRIDGRIEQLFVVQGDPVQQGQVVATLFTPSFISAQTEYVMAQKRAATLAGTQDAEGARALLEAAARRLRLLGASPASIERLGETGEVQENLPVIAPFAGSIVEVQAIPGSAISAGSPIFKVANLDVVDQAAAVPERAQPHVRVGGRASVHLAAYPNLQFEGTVERMEQELDETTRTVNAIIHVPNTRARLMPGMFATVRLHTPVTSGAPCRSQQIITIPETALVNEGDQRFVFVEVAPRTIEKREVEVASLEAPGASHPTTNRVVVRNGLSAGERVVVRGAFTLKSELAKASLGEHGH